MATRTKPGTLYLVYSKEELITALKDTKTRIEETILSYEEKVAKWKEEAPVKFAEWVNNYDPTSSKHWNPSMSGFEPPKLSNACSDYRVQNLNRYIARIGLVSEDTVKLRNDDDIWTYIGLGECL